jgi:hypothetical protein
LQSCYASADAGMNAEGKFLIAVGLVALIIVIWVRWQRNGSGGNDEAC